MKKYIFTESQIKKIIDNQIVENKDLQEENVNGKFTMTVQKFLNQIFKGDKNGHTGSVVPIAFPIIAGSGTLTTIMSLKANFEEVYILLGIIVNLVIVFAVLKSLNIIEKLLGPGGLLAVRKFFGVILLAIAVKIFSSNVGALIR